MDNIIDIAIIGGGAAGLTAGIYGARANLKTVLFEEFFPGGQTSTVELIENYPGFANGIEGNELMQAMNEQATKSGMLTRYEKITSIQKVDSDFVLTNEAGEEAAAKSVIIATGASPRKLSIENEEKYTGRGVHYCATCDGAFYKNKIVMVYGGGNTAVTDALVLSNYAEKVYLVYRNSELKADKILQEKLISNIKIETMPSTVINTLIGNKHLNSVELKNTTTNEIKKIDIDGIFVAIGIIPRSDFVKDLLELSSTSQIITDCDLNTSIEGIFAAGDVRNSNLRQVVTSAADGALAASMAMHYISKR